MSQPSDMKFIKALLHYLWLPKLFSLSIGELLWSVLLRITSSKSCCWPHTYFGCKIQRGKKHCTAGIFFLYQYVFVLDIVMSTNLEWHIQACDQFRQGIWTFLIFIDQSNRTIYIRLVLSSRQQNLQGRLHIYIHTHIYPIRIYVNFQTEYTYYLFPCIIFLLRFSNRLSKWCLWYTIE